MKKFKTINENKVDMEIGYTEEPKKRLEKYSERFDNNKSAIGNPETWGKRIVEDKCTCLCHTSKERIMHVVACCNNTK
jgi:hypothetical protein